MIAIRGGPHPTLDADSANPAITRAVPDHEDLRVDAEIECGQRLSNVYTMPESIPCL